MATSTSQPNCPTISRPTLRLFSRVSVEAALRYKSAAHSVPTVYPRPTSDPSQVETHSWTQPTWHNQVVVPGRSSSAGRTRRTPSDSVSDGENHDWPGCRLPAVPGPVDLFEQRSTDCTSHRTRWLVGGGETGSESLWSRDTSPFQFKS